MIGRIRAGGICMRLGELCKIKRGWSGPEGKGQKDFKRVKQNGSRGRCLKNAWWRGGGGGKEGAGTALGTMYPPMEHLSNDHEDRPISTRTAISLCNKTGHPVVNSMENQWK